MGGGWKGRYPEQKKEMKKERYIQTQKNHKAWDTEGSGNTWSESPEVKEREMRILWSRGKTASLWPQSRLTTEATEDERDPPELLDAPHPFRATPLPKLGPLPTGSPISSPLYRTELRIHSLTGLLCRASQKGHYLTCRCYLKFKIKKDHQGPETHVF